MKKSIAALLLAVFAIGITLAGCKSPKANIEAAAETLLPDWKNGTQENGWYHYPGVTNKKLSAYIKSLNEKGFTVYAQDTSTILVKEGVWIELFDNTGVDAENGGGVELRITEKTAFGNAKLSPERAEELISLYLGEGKNIASLLELTPEGMADKAGLSYYKCIFMEGGERNVASFLTGENGAVQVGADPNDMLVCDADGDGESDVLYTSFGPTSGLFTLYFTAVGVTEGVPYLMASRIYEMAHGVYSLVETDDGPAFSLGRNAWDQEKQEFITLSEALYPVRVEGGDMMIERPEGDESGPMPWGGPGFAYSTLDMRSDIDINKGLTVAARKAADGWSFALLPAEQAAKATPFMLNNLEQLTAEETRSLLEHYALPLEAVSVTVVDFPAKDASFVREATQEEYAELSSLLGLG